MLPGLFAVTLESAFALSELQLDKNVRLLLTDGEELGLVGAERYVEEFGVDGLSLVLNADMIAHRGSAGSLLTREPEGTEYIAQANDAARREAYQLAELARHLPRSVELRPVVFPDDGVSVVGFAVGAVLSDHAPFWLRGIKAVFPFPAGDKPSFYHTPDDTPGQGGLGTPGAHVRALGRGDSRLCHERTMRATTWIVPPLLAFFSVLPAAAREPNVELGLRSVATLSVDDETRGGGAGFAAEAALPVRRELIGPSALFVYASAGVLVGAGLAYQAEAGAALRWTRRTSWQPEVRLSLFWLGGDLVRSIDADGRVAEDPIALRLGLAPLRFRLEDGWVTALAVSVGPTLLRGGEPPLSCSLALFEVGTEL